MLRRWSSNIRTAVTQGGIRGIATTAILVTTLGASGAVDTYPRQWGIDALNYAFSVTFSDDTDRIEGETTIEFRFVEDGVGEFALDLISASADLDGKGMTVSGVTSGGGLHSSGPTRTIASASRSMRLRRAESGASSR